MTRPETVESRLNAFIRVFSLFLILIAAVTAYLTSTTSIAPQLAPVLYLVSVVMGVSGFIALISKFE